MEALVSECKKRNIAITGGETSIQNTSDGMDMSISVSGFVKEIVENRFQSGDVLIGLKSNGLHSNGFTKIREFFKEKIKKDFTEPTKIYVEEIMPVSKYINGMMHMTGGAFTKLKDLLDSQSDVLIHRNHNLKPLPIFTEIYKKGLSDEKMYKTFNCGIGFIISVPKNHVEKVLKKLNGSIIGEVIPGHGQVIVQSKFSNAEVIY
jgi:phosphoribosylformylglycinamidine cyclo-ligase